MADLTGEIYYYTLIITSIFAAILFSIWIINQLGIDYEEVLDKIKSLYRLFIDALKKPKPAEKSNTTAQSEKKGRKVKTKTRKTDGKKSGTKKPDSNKLLEEQRKRVQKREELEKKRKKKREESKKANTNTKKEPSKKTGSKKKESVTVNEPGKKYSNTERKKTTTKKTKKRTGQDIDEVKAAGSEFDQELLHVNYHPLKGFQQKDDWKYAVAKFPENGCVIKPPAVAKFEFRGYKEKSFENEMYAHLPSELIISGEYALPTGENSRPFEPDIVIIHKTPNINLFIDVEIDEPYGGITRSPTHQIQGLDDSRDLYFTHRGWIVVRFAEVQIVKQPIQCISYLAKLIHKIDPSLNFNKQLLQKSDPDSVDRWTSVQAEQWAKENKREEYLQINGFNRRRDKRKISTSIKNRKFDDEIEKQVKFKPRFTDENAGRGVKKLIHDKDKRIQFDPMPHQYYIDGVPVESVTTIVEKHFPTFNTEYAAERYLINRGMPLSQKHSLIEEWEEKGREAREKGTKLHLHIEDYFSENSVRASNELNKEFSHFRKFIDDHSHINPVRTEWRVFDESIRIAGTIDFLSKNKNGTYDIYDWKRSKKIIDQSGEPIIHNQYQSGFGVLRNIDDTSFNKYCLQQGIYRYILEHSYGIEISNMYLIILHPRYSTYHKVPARYWKKPVRHILGYV